jgi:hypothetical protein
MKKTIFLTLGLALILGSCTQNQRAKKWGGTADYDLECNKKLVEVTWKGDQMWFLTRDMKEDEVAETYEFKEQSSYGLLEGTVKIRECKK